jgi:hypothetical protein
MQIGLNDIDSALAAAMEDRLCAPLKEFLREEIHWSGFFNFNWQFHATGLQIRRKREPTAEERRALELRKRREEQTGIRGAVAGLAPLAAGAAVGAGISMVSVEAGVLSGILVWAGGLAAGIRWAFRATPRARVRQSLSLDEMHAVFPLLTLTRAERVYCDALQLLARMDVRPETERTLHDALGQLNDLLASSRNLETRRQSLLPVMGLNSVRELETEYGELGRRLDKTIDPVARQSLEQSLEMCASRLENARVLEASLERLNTQQEAVVQTLSSALSAMARMQITPDPHTEVAAQEISQTVAQMNQQTYAVEQAVQEVVTLRVQ